MFIFPWQEIAAENARENNPSLPGFLRPDSIVAASMPVHAPHTLPHASVEQLQILEILQSRILLPGSGEGEEVFLPAQSMAVVGSGNKVHAFCEDPKMDLGGWLQKCGAWESHYRLILIALHEFLFHSSFTQKGENGTGKIHFSYQIQVNKSDLSSFLSVCFRSRSWLPTSELQGAFESALEESNFFSLLTQSTEKMFADEGYRSKIFSSVEKFLVRKFQQQGLILKLLPIESEWQKERKKEIHAVISSPVSKETVTQKMERQRAAKWMEEVKENSSRCNPKEKEDKEMPLPSLGEKDQIFP